MSENKKKKKKKQDNKKSELREKLIAPIFLIATIIVSYIIFAFSH